MPYRKKSSHTARHARGSRQALYPLKRGHFFLLDIGPPGGTFDKSLKYLLGHSTLPHPRAVLFRR